MNLSNSSAPEKPSENAKPWFLYLIECLDGSIYTGITVDLGARYQAHKLGKGARYTRSHPPQKLLGAQEFPDRSTASKAEFQIKKLSPTEKRQFAMQLDPKLLPAAGNIL